MEAVIDIQINKVENSTIVDFDLQNIPFGKYFTDHMLEANFEDGEWTTVEIKPYQPLMMEPSMAALHYGQAIFEGIKAYKSDIGEVAIFRPYDNFERFNISAERMCMPTVPEEIFIGGLRKLVELDSQWIPQFENHSLYIRPVMFATDTVLGVRPSDNYKFFILLSPSGPYYSTPMKIYVEEKYTRAVTGGVGFSKNAGNYAASMIAAKEAKEKGYDQVLWTDAFEHKWLQEVGMMNVFFVIDGIAVTPNLEDGTILNGVTRKTLITLLEEKGVEVQQRKISIDEVVEAFKSGKLQEVFGSGTAASVAPLKALGYRDVHMEFDMEKTILANYLNKTFNDIKYSKVDDSHGWLYKI